MSGAADPRFVWVDGRILPADGPHLSVFDRGFQLGGCCVGAATFTSVSSLLAIAALHSASMPEEPPRKKAERMF